MLWALVLQFTGERLIGSMSPGPQFIMDSSKFRSCSHGQDTSCAISQDSREPEGNWETETFRARNKRVGASEKRCQDERNVEQKSRKGLHNDGRRRRGHPHKIAGTAGLSGQHAPCKIYLQSTTSCIARHAPSRERTPDVEQIMNTAPLSRAATTSTGG